MWIVSILCISSDGVILRPVSVLYYPTVEKAETFRRPLPLMDIRLIGTPN